MAQVTIVVKENGTAFTHGGVFHADEVMATAMLSIASPEEELRVQRGFRVPEGFTGVIYDIGGGEFDHHQAGGNGARANGVPYASAGLIWRAYGEQIMLDAGAQNAQAAAAAIDAKLIQGIDAVDNGITLKAEGDCQPYTISQIVSSLNPTWDSEESSDEAFVKAVNLAETALQAAIASEVSKQRAAALVQDALREMEAREDNVLLFSRFVPFTETVTNDPAYDRAMFAIFPSLRGGWNVQCVPPAGDPMGQRLPIPEAWRQGPNPEAYRELGLEGVTFVHVNGFLASCGTREEAMAFATKVTAESPAESR